MPAVRPYLLGLIFASSSLTAQSAPAPAARPAVTTLPLRRITLYKNGVGFFELSGKVTGSAFLQIDFTSAQLNDVLQSLTADDLGGGQIANLGYDGTASAGNRGFGPDPTVEEFLQTLKGTQVEVRSGASVVRGKLMSVEVHASTVRTGTPVEHRILSIVTDAGTLRTVELTPSVQITALDGTRRKELGRYLAILSAAHDPDMRHLTFEATGTGEREIHIGYISALPAWKSSYRLLLANGAKSATLDGFAIVDNTTSEDWSNVELTLVSGAPQTFIQQLSRPNNIVRPQIGIQPGIEGGIPPAVKRPDLLAGFAQTSVPVHAGTLGGGEGIQLQAARAPAAGSAPSGTNALSPRTSTAAVDNLFEYKLAKPMTIRHNASFVIPILETTLDSEQVSEWLGRQPDNGVQRAFWLGNTSGLTLDQGSFTVIEGGIYAGQGQLPLMHPNERRLAPYGADQSVKVEARETKEQAAAVRHIALSDGVLTVHHLFPREHIYTLQNVGTASREIVLEVPQSGFVNRMGKRMGPWDLSAATPAHESVGTGTGTMLYRFAVEVEPGATRTFSVIETHSHPTHGPLDKMSASEIEDVIKASGNAAEIAALLQPVLDAKRKMAEFDATMKSQRKAIDEVAMEEARLRQNIAALKGSAEEKALSKRYSDEMIAQEDKLAELQQQHEQAQQQKVTAQKTFDDQIRSLHADIRLPDASASSAQ